MRLTPLRIGLLAFVFVVLPAAYGVAWWLAGDRARIAAEAWIETQKANGYQVGYADIGVGGFPASLYVMFSEPFVAAPEADMPWSWSGEQAVAEFDPLAPDRITVRTSGKQRLEMVTAGRATHYTGALASATAVIVNGRHPLPVGEIRLRDAALRSVETDEALTIGRANAVGTAVVAGSADTATYSFNLTATDLVLPPGLESPLGGTIRSLTVSGSVLGPLDHGRWPQVLTRWRDAGGTVEVAHLAVDYGPMDMEGTGTLALDREGQPMGAFTARIQGFFEAVDALTRQGMIAERDARATKLVLGALSRPSEGSGRPTLTVPITLQDRTLFAGPLPLAKIPEVRWLAVDDS